jgi:CRISPR/Cas system CSM-associated protein Csm3 (group 7 of RAMP superfamily)
MAYSLVVDLEFEFASGLHVGGEEAKLRVDKAVAVDWRDGKTPVIPATTLKGWLRESAERILRGLGVKVCDPSSTGGICVICKIFGASLTRSRIYFSDAVLAGSMTDVRMNVSLSRRRKTAFEERLFSTEVAWKSTINSQIKGWFSSEKEAIRVAAILIAAAKAGYAIGGARSRGLGWLRLNSWTVKVKGEQVPHQNVLDQISALKDPPEVAS